MPIIRVMTFNIHGNAPDWLTVHADLVLGVLRRYSPDLIGLQEFGPPNIEFLYQRLPEYEHELGQLYGEEEDCGYLPILWKKSRFERLDSGNFWLSRTPDLPSSDWGVPYPGGATWIRLHDRLTDIQLLHLN